MTIILPPVWKAKYEANWVSEAEETNTTQDPGWSHSPGSTRGLGGSLFSVLGDLLHNFF